MGRAAEKRGTWVSAGCTHVSKQVPVQRDRVQSGPRAVSRANTKEIHENKNTKNDTIQWEMETTIKFEIIKQKSEISTKKHGNRKFQHG